MNKKILNDLKVEKNFMKRTLAKLRVEYKEHGKASTLNSYVKVIAKYNAICDTISKIEPQVEEDELERLLEEEN